MKIKLKKIAKFTSVIALFAVSIFEANASIITFESDPIGALPNSFVSTDEAGVAFQFLSAEIDDYGIESDGKAIKTLFSGQTTGVSNAGLNIITRPTPFNIGNMNSISFEFGNDDPGVFKPGDQAVMNLLLAGQILAQVTIPLNGDDLLNQSISFSGLEFARVEFAYVDSSFQAIPNMFEVIDNIEIKFGSVPTIPEPSIIALFAVGLLGIGFASRRNLSE